MIEGSLRSRDCWISHILILQNGYFLGINTEIGWFRLRR